MPKKYLKLDKDAPEDTQKFIIDGGGRGVDKTSIEELTKRKAKLQAQVDSIEVDIVELNKL